MTWAFTWSRGIPNSQILMRIPKEFSKNSHPKVSCLPVGGKMTGVLDRAILDHRASEWSQFQWLGANIVRDVAA